MLHSHVQVQGYPGQLRYHWPGYVLGEVGELRNVKKYYDIIWQNIVNWNIDIWNPYYKDPEVGIKLHHCGTLTNMVIIQHPDCIVGVCEIGVLLSTTDRYEGQ